MKRVRTIGTAAIASSILSATAMAGSSSSEAVAVPELDGGMALIALALTAALVAIIKEKRRT